MLAHKTQPHARPGRSRTGTASSAIGRNKNQHLSNRPAKGDRRRRTLGTLVDYRPLGNTGMRVSLLGLGTVKLGRDQHVSYPSKFTVPDSKSAAALLDRARDLGVNLIDTAPAYGTSEATLGKLLNTQRQHWLISTKVGEEFPSHFDFSPAWARHSIERSLQRLATDYLDIALIHSNGDDEQILRKMGTLEVLQELKSQGLIRAVGISHKTTDGGQLAIAMGADVIMTTLSPQHTEQLPVLAAAATRGCGVLVKKALASGYGKPEDLAWVARQPGVSSIVVGTIDVTHLAANVEAVCANA